MRLTTVDIWLSDGFRRVGQQARTWANQYLPGATGDRQVDADLVELHAVLALKRGCRRGR